MASQSYFIVLTVPTRDARNHDKLLPVWGSLRLASTNNNVIMITNIGYTTQVIKSVGKDTSAA